MPLSSLALVTNLRTGKEVIVRVNDRPTSGAAMELSAAAAVALGAGESCRVQVAVRRLGAAPYAAPSRPYQQATLTSAPMPMAEAAALIAPDPAVQTPVAPVVTAPVASGGLLVQVGAYSQRANAEAARDQVGSAGPVSIEPALVGGVSLYRVRLGPWASQEEAERARMAAEALGFAGAKITTR